MNRRSFFQRLAALSAGAAVAHSTEVPAVAAPVPLSPLRPVVSMGRATRTLHARCESAKQVGAKIEYFHVSTGFWDEYAAELGITDNPVWSNLLYRGIRVVADLESGGWFCHAICGVTYDDVYFNGKPVVWDDYNPHGR